MSTMVSARIEDGLYTQATDIMKQMSVTPTQLISSAYTYIVREGCLPGTAKHAPASRALSDAQKQELQEFFTTSMFETDVLSDFVSSADGTEYDELLAAALRDDYESIC
jgi:antitoxin component of RelBE/YafQ-DinJ toxin-antitoxin module